MYGQTPGADLIVDGYGDAEFGGKRSIGIAHGGFHVIVKGGLVSLKAQAQGGVTRTSNEAETIKFTHTWRRSRFGTISQIWAGP